MANMANIIFILLMVPIIGIGIFIQVKLSRSENKFLGLILPIITFFFSLMIVLSISVGVFAFSEITTSVDGVVQSTEILESTGGIQKGISALGIFFIFLISNIPTAILGGIYAAERNRMKTNRFVEKMKIEDL